MGRGVGAGVGAGVGRRVGAGVGAGVAAGTHFPFTHTHVAGQVLFLVKVEQTWRMRGRSSWLTESGALPRKETATATWRRMAYRPIEERIMVGVGEVDGTKCRDGRRRWDGGDLKLVGWTSLTFCEMKCRAVRSVATGGDR